ncbi:MAG: sodium:solute symporter [Planctomycetota bacterium]|nr:sodium:solute symporter [Planctomycetota bacterium]
MSAIDWLVFFAFLGYVVWDGARRRTKTNDLEGYYAGGRKIPWWAAGLSIMATQASAITVIGTTGQGHDGGMEFVQSYFGLPFAMVLLCIFLVPYFRSRNVLTPYELLEDRFGPASRTLASLIFLCSRCLALGAVIYAPSVALSAVLGVNTMLAVFLIGALTTTYTMLGGVSAVIWTDVKQMAVILVGLVIVFVMLLRDLLPEFGSFQTMLEVAGAADKLGAVEITPAHDGLLPRTHAEVAAGEGAPSFWEEKYNVWAGLFGGLFLHLSYFGCDNSQAQRLLTSPDADQSKKSLLMSAFAKVPMQGFILLIGVLMWLFYATHEQPMLFKPDHVAKAESPALAPQVAQLQARFDDAHDERKAAMLALAARDDRPAESLAATARYQRAVRDLDEVRREARILVGGKVDGDGAPRDDKDTNNIFCRYVLDQLPPILLGLIIAAIFAAAMSSIDSVLNALSGATVVDVYRRWVRPDASDAQSLRVGRYVTLFWGVTATFTALFFAGGGSIIEMINRVGSWFYGSLLGIFVMALFFRRAGDLAGALGLCGGMAAVVLVHNTVKVQFLWYNVVGLAGVLVVGGLTALVATRR